MALLALLLIDSALLFFGILEDVVSGDPLVRANTAVYQMLQDLRTELGDAIMLVITELERHSRRAHSDNCRAFVTFMKTQLAHLLAGGDCRRVGAQNDHQRSASSRPAARIVLHRLGCFLPPEC